MRSAEDTDVTLLRRVAAGDEAAFGDLYARYGGVVFGFASARLPDRGVAEEVCADVWLGCWRSASAFRGDSRVLTWLLGITKRQISMHTRRRTLPVTSLDESVTDLIAETEVDPAALVVSADEAETLLDALRALPVDLAEVIRLAWVQELPYGEIAEIVGVPVGTVKSRVSRARRLLRDELRRSHDEPHA